MIKRADNQDSLPGFVISAQNGIDKIPKNITMRENSTLGSSRGSGCVYELAGIIF